MKTTVLTAAVGAALASSAANGAVTTSFLDTDADFVNLLNNGVSELWVAQGRIGNAGASGDQEFDLGFTSAAPLDQRQFAWGNNQPVAFDVSYDAGTDVLSFTAAGQSVMTLANAGAASELYIRVRATNQRPDLSLDLSNLLFDGSAIAGVGTNNTTLDGVDYLVISGIGGASFTLTGDATLGWQPGNAPSGSNLAFQIKGAVPTPGAAALAGLAGLAAVRRRR